MESVESIGVRAIALSKYLTDYNGSGAGYPGGVVIARHSEARNCEIAADIMMGQFAVDHLGYQYDTAELMKILGRIVNSVSPLIPWTVGEQKALLPNREYSCAEYAYECLSAMRLKVTPDVLGFISPANFADDERIELLAVLKRP